MIQKIASCRSGVCCFHLPNTFSMSICWYVGNTMYCSILMCPEMFCQHPTGVGWHVLHCSGANSRFPDFPISSEQFRTAALTIHLSFIKVTGTTAALNDMDMSSHWSGNGFIFQAKKWISWKRQASLRTVSDSFRRMWTSSKYKVCTSREKLEDTSLSRLQTLFCHLARDELPLPELVRFTVTTFGLLQNQFDYACVCVLVAVSMIGVSPKSLVCMSL